MKRIRFFDLLFISLLFAIGACGTDDSANDSDDDDDGGSAGGDMGADLSNTGDGSDAGTTDGGGSSNTACDPSEAAEGPAVVGMFYTDTNGTDYTTYESGFEALVDEPVVGRTVELMGSDGETRVSCDDGSFAFGGLTDGAYLVVPEVGEDEYCGTKNCPDRFPEAVAEGDVTLVTFGDSVAVVGDAVLFPERLATLISPLATVNNINVAIGGTISSDWLPGTTNFDNTLVPVLPDADVIMVTLGGNDFLAYASNPALLGDLDAAVAGAEDLVRQVLDNLLAIAAGIREVNPDADIVYCLYPDYGNSSESTWSMIDGFLGAGTVSSVLELARSSLPADADIIVADMFGATEGMDFAPLMYDSLHPNGAGHTFYAEEIFMVLGGVLIGDNPLTDGRATPFGLDVSFSLVP